MKISPHRLQPYAFRSKMCRMKYTLRPLPRLTLRLFLMLTFLIGSIGCLSSCNTPFSDQQDDEVKVWKTDPNCHLHQGLCTIRNGSQSVTLDISPNNPIPVAHLLDATVKLKGFHPQNVQIDIAGINMYMGYNRTTLIPLANQPNLYHNKIMLAFCTNEKMDWEISVLITNKDNHIVKVPFQLSTRSR